MGLFLSAKELARLCLPLSTGNAVFSMLAAYFDDSGTHGGDIVVVAGVFGYVNQIDYLSELWRKQLASPCPGKLPLSEFHMAECQSSHGEFAGWKRHETDFLVHELGTALIKSGIYGFGCALARKEYDELMIGDLRKAHGDAETFCLINAFVKVLRLSAQHTPDSHILIMFDNRPQKRVDLEKIYAIYKDSNGLRLRDAPSIEVLAFGSSKKIPALQAADMVAWEFYQDGLDALSGRREEQGARRQQLNRLAKTDRFFLEYGGPENIKSVTKIFDPNVLAQMASHMDFD